MGLPLIPIAIGGAALVNGAAQLISGSAAAQATKEAQEAANKANIQMNTETNLTNTRNVNSTNALNLQLAHEQMDYQTEMANSAYQRAVLDMKKAGLNPMLAYSQGGASSPTGPNLAVMDAPQVQAGHVDPVDTSGFARAAGEAGKIIGSGIADVGNSALNAEVVAKELESKDAQIAAAKASALASAAQANNANSSARATEASLPAIQARSRAAGSEADVKSATADFDKKAVVYDGVVKRVLNAIGGFSDAVNIFKVFKQMKNADRDQIMKEESHLRDQGSLGTQLP